MAKTKLVKGDKLSPEARKQVLAAFIYRNTKENEVMSKRIQPKVDCSQSDDQWLASHAFYITADGRLSDREKRCEPASMANESEEDFGSEIEYKGKHYYPFWDDVEEDDLIPNTLANSEGLDVDVSDLKLVKGTGHNMEAVNKSGLIVAVLDTKNNTAYMIAESKVNESDSSVWITGETMLRSKNPEYKGKAYPFANMMNGTDVYVHDTDNGGIQMFLGKDSNVEVVNESKSKRAPLPTFESFKRSMKVQESDETVDSVLTKVFGSNIVADDISKNWDIKRKSISDDSKVKEFVDGLKADGYKTKTKKNSDFTYVVGVKAKANESRINEDQVIYYVNMSIDASIKMKPEGSKDLEYLLEMQKDLPMIAALADNKNFAGKCVAYRVEVDTARATIAFWIENVISGKPIPPEMESRIAASFGKFGKRFRIIKHKPTSWLVAMEYSVGAGSTTPKTEISRVIGESKSMNEAKGAEFEELIDELFSNSKTPNMKMLKGASTGIYDKVTAILWNYFDKGDIKSWEDAEMKVSNDPKIGEILATIEESLKLQESFSFEGTSLNAVQELKVDSKRITSKDEGGFIRVYVDGKEIYMCSNDSTVSKKLKPLLDVISKQTQVTFTMCEGTGDGKEYNHSGPGLFIYMESLLICRTCKLKKRDGMDAPIFNMLRTTAKSIGFDTSKLPDWAV